MALFESASKQLVKDTGRCSLHPVLDLNSSSKCKIMCVVEKKERRWFWKKTKFLPTPFTLNDFMLEPVDYASTVKASEFTANYSNEPNLHVSGKLGAKLAGELGIDLSTADSFVVKMDLGNLNKHEIKWQDLDDLLKDKKVNLKHEFVQGILKSKRRKLCIVNEVITTSKSTTIQSDLQVEGGADAKATATTKASVDMEGSVKDTHHHSLDVLKDTVMAYSCYEFNFDSSSGVIELVIDETLVDTVDGTVDGTVGSTGLPFDQPDGKDSALISLFDTLLKSQKKDNIIKCFKQIMATPDSLKPIGELSVEFQKFWCLKDCEFLTLRKSSALEHTLDSIEGDVVKSYTLQEFKSLVGPCEGWEELLTLLGFTIETKKDGGIDFATDAEDAKDLVISCSALTGALDELSNTQCLALKDLTHEYVEPLLYLIRNAIYGKSTHEDDPQLKRIYTHKVNPGKIFLLSLGFVEGIEEGKKVLTLSSKAFTPLEDAYVAVFVIGSKKTHSS